MPVINYEILNLRLQKSIFLPNHAYKKPENSDRISLSISMRNEGEFFQNNTRVNFLQSFKTNAAPEMPFSLEVEFAALFALTAPVPQAEHDSLIHLVFAHMVFPHTREYVAETTRRGGFPPLILDLGLFEDKHNNRSGTELESANGQKWIH
jgi:preprotein translocase subunit SecB